MRHDRSYELTSLLAFYHEFTLHHYPLLRLMSKRSLTLALT
jgi:hypothetical protein